MLSWSVFHSTLSLTGTGKSSGMVEEAEDKVGEMAERQLGKLGSARLPLDSSERQNVVELHLDQVVLAVKNSVCFFDH